MKLKLLVWGIDITIATLVAISAVLFGTGRTQEGVILMLLSVIGWLSYYRYLDKSSGDKDRLMITLKRHEQDGKIRFAWIGNDGWIYSPTFHKAIDAISWNKTHACKRRGRASNIL